MDTHNMDSNPHSITNPPPTCPPPNTTFLGAPGQIGTSLILILKEKREKKKCSIGYVDLQARLPLCALICDQCLYRDMKGGSYCCYASPERVSRTTAGEENKTESDRKIGRNESRKVADCLNYLNIL